jgi:hypothetical protein
MSDHVEDLLAGAYRPWTVAVERPLERWEYPTGSAARWIPPEWAADEWVPSVRPADPQPCKTTPGAP